ncbi:MAG: GerAB/ArcD/ProY family transporter, partial [Syntrophomonadaceae bacterium]|nr:GerAB/ArcD/ProY family transporter [Syntrophomonadaceae bacterium]
YYCYGVGTLVSVIRSFLVLGILGANYMQLSRFPFYDVFRLLQFQEFQRVELFFFVLFFTTVSFAIILNNQALTLAFKQLFNLKSASTLIIPVGFLVLALCYNSFPSDVKYLATQANSATLII